MKEKERKMLQNKVSHRGLAGLLAFFIAICLALGIAPGFGASKAFAVTQYDADTDGVTVVTVVVPDLADGETDYSKTRDYSSDQYLSVSYSYFKKDKKGDIFAIPVNPEIANGSWGSVKRPVANQMYVDLARYTSKTDNHDVFVPQNITTIDLDIDYSDPSEEYYKRLVNGTADGSGSTEPRGNFTYNEATGMLSIATEYQNHEVTIYNYITESQANASKPMVYANVSVDGEEIPSTALNPSSTQQVVETTTEAGTGVETHINYKAQLSIDKSNYFNVAMQQLRVNNGNELYLGYDCQNVSFRGAVLGSVNEILYTWELAEGTDYWISDDGTIEFNQYLPAGIILMDVDLETHDDVASPVSPVLLERTSNSLSFVKAGDGYYYRLTKQAKQTSTKLVSDWSTNPVYTGLTAGKYTVDYKSPQGNITSRTFNVGSDATADNYVTPFAENEKFTTTMYAIGHAGGNTSARATQHNEVIFEDFTKDADKNDDGAKFLNRYVATPKASAWLTGHNRAGWSADLCLGPEHGVMGVSVECITPVDEQVKRGVAVFRVKANLSDLGKDDYAGDQTNEYIEASFDGVKNLRPMNNLYGYFTVDLNKPIHFELTKQSDNPNITTTADDGKNGAYDVNNAEYQITAGAPAGTVEADLKYYTDADGRLVTLDFPAETAYTIKETDASDHGYMINASDNIFPAVANDFGKVYTKTVTETPMSKTWNFFKLDAESNTNQPQSGASMADGVFKVSYYAVSPITGSTADDPERAWYLKSDETGQISLDPAHLIANYDGKSSSDFYRNKAGAIVYPLGIYTLEELSGPTGYQTDDTAVTTHKFDVTRAEQNGTQETIAVTDSVRNFKDKVIRGDLKFFKEDAKQQRMPKVPFTLTNKDTGETHVIMTDDNGLFDSSTANLGATVNKDTNTNGNDNVVDANGDGNFTDEEAEAMDESKLNVNTGNWFQGYKNNDPIATPVDNARGALPYGHYRLEELPCDANFGKQLVAIDDILIDANGVKSIGNVNREGTIEDADVVIGTILTDEVTKTHLGNASFDSDAKPVETVSIVDEITVSGLTVGKSTHIDVVPYKVTEYAEDGTPSKTEPLLDTDGKQYTFTTGEFTPTSDISTQYVTIELPASAVLGQDIVDCESLHIGKLHRADHDPLDYETQSGFDWGHVVTYPIADDILSIDKTSQSVEGIALGDNVTIMNTIQYKKLTRGQQYVVKGTAYTYDADGNPVLLTDTEGNTFTTEQRLERIEARDGEFSLEVAVPRNLAEGKAISMFVQVIGTGDNDGRVIVSNLSDKVYYPKMMSTAYDSSTKAHEGSASPEQVTVNAIATYQNLNLDKNYVMRSVLLDKSNDQVIKNADGTEMTYDVKFTAGRGVFGIDEIPDVIDVDESLAALSTQLDTLYKLATYAKDNPDKFTGIDVPTLADPKDVMDAINKSIADEDVDGIDAIAPELEKYAAWYGVLTEEERTENGLVAQLPTKDEITALIQQAIAKAETDAASGDMDAMDTEDGDGTETESVLDPSLRAAGSFPIHFDVDSAAIAGKKVVVKHYLFAGEEINDDAKVNELTQLEGADDRTVSYPKFTAAATVNGVHVATALPDTTLIETVQYVNMIPGQEYRMVGVLMNAKTGDVMGVNDNPITAQTVFTPQDANGTVDIEFNFDASRFADKDVVVFMNAYRNSDTLNVTEYSNDVPDGHDEIIDFSAFGDSKESLDEQFEALPKSMKVNEIDFVLLSGYEITGDDGAFETTFAYNAELSGMQDIVQTAPADTEDEALALLPESLDISGLVGIPAGNPVVVPCKTLDADKNVIPGFTAIALYEAEAPVSKPALIETLNDQLINVGSIEDLTLAAQTVHFEPQVLPAPPISETGDMLLRAIGGLGVIAVAVAGISAYRRRKHL